MDTAGFFSFELHLRSLAITGKVMVMVMVRANAREHNSISKYNIK